MSAGHDQTTASGLRFAVLDETTNLSLADQAAVHATAQRICAAIAEADEQTKGLGLLAFGLVAAGLQEQAL